MKMNKILLTGFAIIAGLSGVAPRADAAPPGYNLVWSDEFNSGAGSVPNPNVWNYDTGAGGWGNNEWETYVNSQANCHVISDPAAVDGQALQIEVQTDASGRYYSARINTGGKVGLGPYGYIEYRAQLPGGNAQGMWPAGWMLGTNGQQWPYCGEIDVMEEVNGQDVNHGSLHSPGWDPTGTIGVTGLTSAYHTYSALWQPGAITFYVDGNAYETQTSSGAPGGSWVFDGQPFFVILNCAVGGNFPGSPNSSTTIPADLKFDYVRFYQNNGQNPAEAPYGGSPASIPGTVQAENYDVGGQNVAYNESGFNGSADYYRVDGNDIEATTDSGGGYDVGWTNNGQWMKYTVNATSGGAYTVTCRVASGASGGTFHIENNSGTNLSGTITVPATGGWQTWTTVNANVNLPAGQQTLKLVEDTGGYNINYLTFAFNQPVEGPYNGTPASIPGTVQAENYDTGGQGVAYNVASTNGSANGYRADGVDLETTTDAGGGYDLGWTAAGQWFKYTVNVQSAGTYNVACRVANGTTGNGSFHIQNASGVNLSGSITAPSTGGWQTWTTVNATVTLPAGQQTLTVWQDTGGFNMNYFTFTGQTPPPAAPTNLNGTAGNGLVNLNWNASSGATSYNVYSNGSLVQSGITGTSTQVTGLTNGTTYPFTAAAVNSAGTSGMSNQISLTPSGGSSEGPYGGTPASIPGTVQAENYDTGGQGVAFNATAGNGSGNSYRTDGVDLETTGDTGGGYDLGWTSAGQWFRYTVNVSAAGTYTVSFRVAAPNAVTDGFHLSSSTGGGTGNVNVPSTGGWQNWTTVTATMTLAAGRQVLTLSEDNGGWNVNFMSFASNSTLTPAAQIDCGSPSAVAPFSADADFSAGNEFSSANAINLNGQSNAAPAAVYQSVRWNSSFNYTIPNLTPGASYTVRLHFCELTWTAAGQRKFNVAINGNTVLSAFDVFQAAGGQNKALVETFTATANSSGQIVVNLTQGGADNPDIAGIEVLH